MLPRDQAQPGRSPPALPKARILRRHPLAGHLAGRRHPQVRPITEGNHRSFFSTAALDLKNALPNPNRAASVAIAEKSYFALNGAMGRHEIRP
jgi:hypothetical protein